MPNAVCNREAAWELRGQSQYALHIIGAGVITVCDTQWSSRRPHTWSLDVKLNLPSRHNRVWPQIAQQHLAFPLSSPVCNGTAATRGKTNSFRRDTRTPLAPGKLSHAQHMASGEYSSVWSGILFPGGYSVLL